jgi:non-ribosomal peptide synthetase component F
VSTPFLNRHVHGCESVLGSFSNLLPIPVEPGNSRSFDALLHEVRDQVLQAYIFQDLPFRALLESRGCSVHAERNRLFQVILDYRAFDMPHAVSQWGEVVPMQKSCGSDLLITVTIREARLTVCLESRAGLFSRTRFNELRKLVSRRLSELDSSDCENSSSPAEKTTESIA